MQVVDWIARQAGKLADHFQPYKFFVKSTPDHVDSSSRLFLNAYTSRDEEALVPCIYRWFRTKNGIVSEVAQFKGNTFICEPSDVGCTLEVQITSIDQQYPGTALLKFGPIEIDVMLRQTIQAAVSTGQATFQVDLMFGDRMKQCTLLVSDDWMRIGHCNSSVHFKFGYCLGEPLINTTPKDPTNVEMAFPQKYETQAMRFINQLWSDVMPRQLNSRQGLVVLLKFVNRRFKDQFLFAMKGFNAKKQLRYSSVVKKIQKMQVDQSNINLILEIQSLRKDLIKLYNISRKVQEEKRVYMDQTFKLEQQIQDIITSYTKLIQGKFKTKQQFEESFIQFQNKKDTAVSNRYRKIEQENIKLKDYIKDKMDGGLRDTYINELRQSQGRVDSSPFAKKRSPFAELQLNPQPHQTSYPNFFNNMSIQSELVFDQRKNYEQLMNEKQKLSQKLNKSLLKIQKLQQQIDKMNRSAVGASNSFNLSTSRHNISALEMSASKVVQEKALLESKYTRLKEEYRKLKSANQKQRNVQSDSANPEYMKEEHTKEMIRLKSAFASLEREKDGWKQKAQSLGASLRKQKEQSEKTKAKLQKKITELSQQLQMIRKNSDCLNRSQHLSMQMQQLNSQQNSLLTSQNNYLTSENEKLQKMCEKYKSQYKRMKMSCKSVAESILIE